MNLRFALAALPLLGLAATPAKATTIDLITNVINAPSGVSYQDFDSYPAGVYSSLSWDRVKLAADANVVDDATGIYVLGTGEVGNEYVAISGGSSLTFTFTGPASYLGFLWGTVDDFNTATFYDGDTVVGSFSGADLLDPPDGVSAIYANFYAVGGTFTSVVLASGGNSFEFDNVRVAATPLPAALGLFGMAVAGMGVLGVKRRRFA